MQSETYQKQSTPLDEKVVKEDTVVQPTARRIPYKSVLAAVVIAIIAISVLLLILQDGSPATNPIGIETDMQVQADAKVKELKVTRSEDAYRVIDRKLSSLSSRVELGFRTQQTDDSDVERKLTVIAEGINEIKVVISALGESNKELARRVTESTSQLETITKEVRALKVVKRKATVKSKTRSIKTPPFHIDAIDVWDDATYVAVSQAGRVAFLKEGEQQSGWKITNIDSIKGRVDLQGPAGQDHSISLQR